MNSQLSAPICSSVHEFTGQCTSSQVSAPIHRSVYKPTNGGLLASTGADRTIRVWDTNAQIIT
jgi:WD40 repeat protein